MVAMTRRLHMGCGETLQSHLPDSFRKVAFAQEIKQEQLLRKQKHINRKGKFWK